jgi:hypothetical protein
LRFRKERQFDWMRLDMALKKSSSIHLGPKKSLHFLMHWMSVKLPDNFQICEHSWPCLFHIKFNVKNQYLVKNSWFFSNFFQNECKFTVPLKVVLNTNKPHNPICLVCPVQKYSYSITIFEKFPYANVSIYIRQLSWF